MSDDGGFGGFKARIMAGWLKEAAEANAALAARVRELEEAQGELLDLVYMHPAELASLLSFMEARAVSGLEGIEDAKDAR